MTREEIGFKHGIPENPDKTWEKQIHDKTFIFTKERVGKNGVFVYNCARYSEEYINARLGNVTSASSTGFHSERNLTPDEVEQWPQIADFIALFKPA